MQIGEIKGSSRHIDNNLLCFFRNLFIIKAFNKSA